MDRTRMSTQMELLEAKPLVVNKRYAPFDVYIGRGSPWGNPFTHVPSSFVKTMKVKSRREAIDKYKAWLLAQPELVERARLELRGKVLGCYCKPLACHGDVLSAIANS